VAIGELSSMTLGGLGLIGAIIPKGKFMTRHYIQVSSI
jgi:hypothetical protein